MAKRQRALTATEVQDRVLVALGSGQLERIAPVAKRADVKLKEAVEAIPVLVREGKVAQWPAIKAYKITQRGLEAVAAIESRTDTRFQWTWNKRGSTYGS